MIQKDVTKITSTFSTSKKSTRSLPKENIRVVTLGRGNPAVPGYNKQTLTRCEIETFVNDKIRFGYQIVCLPMPPDESHSFVVQLSKSGDVMISDFGGEKSRYIKSHKWKNYTTFIHLLEIKYRHLKYYSLDLEISEISYKRYKANNGQGRCSEYVHYWIEKYIGKNEKAILFINA
jgi:hypothetical protein